MIARLRVQVCCVRFVFDIIIQSVNINEIFNWGVAFFNSRFVSCVMLIVHPSYPPPPPINRLTHLLITHP